MYLKKLHLKKTKFFLETEGVLSKILRRKKRVRQGPLRLNFGEAAPTYYWLVGDKGFQFWIWRHRWRIRVRRRWGKPTVTVRPARDAKRPTHHHWTTLIHAGFTLVSSFVVVTMIRRGKTPHPYPTSSIP